MFVRGYTTGTKSFFYRKKIDGVQMYVSLGYYPQLSLATARELGMRANLLFKEGYSWPVVSRALQYSKSAEQLVSACQKIDFDGEIVELQQTYNQLYEAWLPWKEAQMQQGASRNQLKTIHEAHILPAFGELHVSEIGKREIIKLLQPVYDTKFETAQKALRQVRSVFDYAENRGIIDNKPTPSQSAFAKPLRPTKHANFFNYREAPKIVASLFQQDNSLSVKWCLIFLFLTGHRSAIGENAIWERISDARYIIPARTNREAVGHMKAGHGRVSYLLDHFVAALKKINSKQQGLIFPNSYGKKLTNAALNKALKKLHDASVHGFRTTIRGYFEDNNPFNDYSKTTIFVDYYCDHKVSGVQRAYQRSERDNGLKRMADEWYEFLMSEVQQ